MKSSKIITLLLVLISNSILINGCVKDMGKLPIAVVTPSASACDTITYTNHIKKIFTANCISCHADAATGNSGVGFATYADVKLKGETGRIKARVIDGTGSFMPQGGELNAADKNLITCWLNNGMKE